MILCWRSLRPKPHVVCWISTFKLVQVPVLHEANITDGEAVTEASYITENRISLCCDTKNASDSMIPLLTSSASSCWNITSSCSGSNESGKSTGPISVFVVAHLLDRLGHIKHHARTHLASFCSISFLRASSCDSAKKFSLRRATARQRGSECALVLASFTQTLRHGLLLTHLTRLKT